MSGGLTSHPGQLSLSFPPCIGTMSTIQRALLLCSWGVKAGMVREWVSCKTVRSPSYHGPYLHISEMRFTIKHCTKFTNRRYFALQQSPCWILVDQVLYRFILIRKLVWHTHIRIVSWPFTQVTHHTWLEQPLCQSAFHSLVRSRHRIRRQIDRQTDECSA